MLHPLSSRSLPQPGHLYDTAIIGAGLAGSELAWHLARAGRDVLLVSQSLDSVGNLYHASVTNTFPTDSLFELARTHALPDSSSSESTLWAFHCAVKALLEQTPGIHLLQSCVAGLSVQPDEPHVLRTWEGPALQAQQVVLAVGSFLRGRLQIDQFEEEAGRLSEVAYDFLWEDLAAQGLGFEERMDQFADKFTAESGSSPYQVRYLTLAASELEEFQVKRWSRVYALGRCIPGELDYTTTLEQATELANQLIGAPSTGALL